MPAGVCETQHTRMLEPNAQSPNETNPQVRLYDALRATGLPPAQLREAVLLRGQAAGNTEPPRLRLPTDEFVLWVSSCCLVIC